MDHVNNYVNSTPALGVTLNIEYVDGEKGEAKKFLENCKYANVCYSIFDGIRANLFYL